MKNTIDDADYIINSSYFIIMFQWVTNFSYSHSIVNQRFLRFYINGLLVGVGGNTMINTMLSNGCRLSLKITILTRPICKLCQLSL